MRPGSGTYESKFPTSLPLMRVVISIVALIVLLTPVVRAQQHPLLTQYMFNQMAYNPGYAGSNGGICVNGLLREQWMGFKDNDANKIAPESLLFTIDAPIRFLHGALGGSVLADKIGFYNNIGVKIGYAFRMDLGAGEFGAGIQANLMNYRIDFAKFDGYIIQPGDPVLQELDKKSALTIDADMGVYYEVPDQYYIGFSALQLFQSQSKNLYYKQRRTYFLTGGYNWVIPNHPTFELKPSAIITYDGAVFQFNIAALVAYKKKFWGGLEYRLQDAVAILVGANIKSFRIGMSYDIGTSALNRYNNGSFEVMVGYCFKIELEKSRKRYKNTRFL